MTESPRPTPPQSQASPQPQSQSAPTPASVSGDVPVDSWRTHLTETKDAPATQRHERLGALLDELDSQVGSL